MRYVVHRHRCNAWCRPPLHAGLIFSRRPGDISDRVRTNYEGLGYRVLDLRRATEVPLDEPGLIVRPHPWLVFFALASELRVSASPATFRLKSISS